MSYKRQVPGTSQPRHSLLAPADTPGPSPPIIIMSTPLPPLLQARGFNLLVMTVPRRAEWTTGHISLMPGGDCSPTVMRKSFAGREGRVCSECMPCSAPDI